MTERLNLTELSISKSHVCDLHTLLGYQKNSGIFKHPCPHMEKKL